MQHGLRKQAHEHSQEGYAPGVSVRSGSSGQTRRSRVQDGKDAALAEVARLAERAGRQVRLAVQEGNSESAKFYAEQQVAYWRMLATRGE